MDNEKEITLLKKAIGSMEMEIEELRNDMAQLRKAVRKIDRECEEHQQRLDDLNDVLTGILNAVEQIGRATIKTLRDMSLEIVRSSIRVRMAMEQVGAEVDEEKVDLMARTIAGAAEKVSGLKDRIREMFGDEEAEKNDGCNEEVVRKFGRDVKSVIDKMLGMEDDRDDGDEDCCDGGKYDGMNGDAEEYSGGCGDDGSNDPGEDSMDTVLEILGYAKGGDGSGRMMN